MPTQPSSAEREYFDVRILRQDRPETPSYWERFRVPYEPGLNITSVLQKIAANPVTATNKAVAPVAYDANCLEEVCGSCTMLVNGRVAQGCSSLVDRLLSDGNDVIELRPLTKFPVIRDLMVARDRLFRALEKLECWVEVDDYNDRGPGPRQSPDSQQQAYPLSTCISCGSCLEACPQYKKIELIRRPEETEEEFAARRQAEYDRQFIGAHANSQVMLMNSHPIGRMMAERRLDALMAPGGIQDCGKAANCQAVCPKRIPLMTSWGRAGRAVTMRALRRWFDQ